MPTLIDKSCCYNFDDLHRAALGRVLEPDEKSSLYALSQVQRNQWVWRMVERTTGRFACEDRRGTDGGIYTAFWAVE